MTEQSKPAKSAELLRRDALHTPGEAVAFYPGGLETTLLFKTDFPLREFASFEILFDERYSNWLLEEVYNPAILTGAEVAAKNADKTVLILISAPTWRASPDYFAKLGYDNESAAGDVARRATKIISRALERRDEYPANLRLLSAAEIGPRGDGYVVDAVFGSVADAKEYHMEQMKALLVAGVEVAMAFTITTANEAAGIALAAKECGIPVAIVFTLGDKQACLPDGTHLADAVAFVDDETSNYALFFGINCIHPRALEKCLTALQGQPEKAKILNRINGIWGNASEKTHEELDGCDELDEGDAKVWADVSVRISDHMGIRVLGGCCGTGHGHLEELAARSAGLGA
eukprot:CAMPEP_0198320276 /NCGR_PEP_ID=MMETSP1450-20131203/9244_1 /TAXON_ID=753684 ORGANISM="Madagascaria erythrocladiodes, Strain CCMP3234" /NCGR_SAMPLE_ID=MMETSP1450 /ASSEMBLY_ACC=CAM_ASM_001115 /LENGTH=345 /DNA_ID=CAMNT_0044023731 /DNA_START=64 /DNA_END=1098 /DNA_ORIENTATION=-